MALLSSIPVFLLAGLCEIGGGYLVWLWLKEDKPWWYGIVGLLLLALYGIVATWQTASFARVYAAYGGVFVVMSILWAMKFDKFSPDKYDLIGAAFVLLGVGIMYYSPRS